MAQARGVETVISRHALRQPHTNTRHLFSAVLEIDNFASVERQNTGYYILLKDRLPDDRVPFWKLSADLIESQRNQALIIQRFNDAFGLQRPLRAVVTHVLRLLRNRLMGQ